VFPITEFGLNKSNIDGLSKNCKQCKRDQQKKDYQKHREKRMLDMKAYYESNKAILMEKQKIWNDKNIDKVRKIKNDFNKRNRDQVNERRNKNPDIYRKWDNENPEKRREFSNKRAKKNRIELADIYVKSVIVNHTNMKHADVPDELVETYRNYIKIKRLINELSN
jgi:hypothetical protein